MTYQEFNCKYSQEYGVFLSKLGNDFTDSVYVNQNDSAKEIVKQYFGVNGCFTSTPLNISISYVKDLLSCFIKNDKIKEVIDILYSMKERNLIRNNLID